jgi:hypothetical protein
MLRRHVAGICLLTLAIGGVAARASADDGVENVSAPASLSTVFQGAARRAAAAPAPTGDHVFGVGLRLGGYSFGVGGTVRYFLMGPWGVQAEASRYGIGVAGLGYDYHTTMFDFEVLYRLNEIKLEAPLKLQPYAGGGVAILRTSFDVLGTSSSNNSTGGVITGGVEVFFEQVPKLGVSGAFEWTFAGDFNSVSLAGPAFLASAHWYFK